MTTQCVRKAHIDAKVQQNVSGPQWAAEHLSVAALITVLSSLPSHRNCFHSFSFSKPFHEILLSCPRSSSLFLLYPTSPSSYYFSNPPSPLISSETLKLSKVTKLFILFFWPKDSRMHVTEILCCNWTIIDWLTSTACGKNLSVPCYVHLFVLQFNTLSPY